MHLVPDADLLRRHDRPGPRYTSYPTAAQFYALTAQDHAQACARGDADAPLSLYVHAPFCASPCFYCGCTRVITRDAQRMQRYVDAACTEIALQARLFDVRRPVEQLHFGGGTPTAFTDAQLGALLAQIERSFGFVAPAQREFSIELDPRTVDAARLENLARLGFNRISLGVQDFDVSVQQAVNRVQPEHLTAALVQAGRRLGLRSIAFDLIYGLPRQTLEGFTDTLDRVVALQPDRIAIYGYAHLPAMFKAQRHIHAHELPDAALRLALVQRANTRLTQAGYVHIGLDHFARPDDELAHALQHGGLQRNFQGYSTRAGLDLLGIGLSAISHIGGAYTQNARALPEYLAAVEHGRLPTSRGCVLSDEDHLRAEIIERLMCDGQVHFTPLSARHRVDVAAHFADAFARLAPAVVDGLLERGGDHLRVTARGRYFLRSLAMAFDAYLFESAPAPAPGPAPSLPAP